jgi:glucoside 3-dehydrogenase (cytochrome c) hitch-hiker subunit
MAMTRRDWLATAAAALALPPVSEDLFALGRRLRARAVGEPLRVLDPQQSELVATIADLIIPQTDTPGARAAGAHQFIDLALAEWMDDADRQRFLAGLADLDAQAGAAYGGGFLQCSPAQRTALLTALDENLAAERDAARAGTAWRGRPAAPDRSFFQTMKRLTLVGYYTSEIGATQELHYQIIPGRYDPCYPLESAQRGGE